MLNVTSVTAISPDEIRKRLSHLPGRYADLTVGYLSMWAKDFAIGFTGIGGREYLCAMEDGMPVLVPLFSLPETAGGMAEWIGDLAPALPERFRLSLLPEEECRRVLEGSPFPARVGADADTADYLYDAESLRTYAGKKLSAKRNHINAFLREHPGYRVTPLSPENLPEVLRFYAAYRIKEEDETASAHREGDAAERLLNQAFSLQQSGVVLQEDQQIFGFALGEVRGDTLYVHLEKAFREVRGAYPMLCRSFASAFPDVLYVNREEDDGDEGLRRSKESYQPMERLYKHYVEITVPR